MAPLGLLERLRSYWPYGKAAVPPPPLSTGFAVAVSVRVFHSMLGVRSTDSWQIAFTLSYVAPFYLSSTTRPSRTITRDSPTVIKARVRAVLLSCSVCTGVALYIFSVTGRLPYYDSLHLLGLWPVSFVDVARSLGLVMTLFSGPLFESLIVEEAWRDLFSNPAGLLSKLFSPIGFRNYIAGPFSEELLFRSLLIPLNLLSPQVTQASTGLKGTHARLVLFTTPLYFGVAHLHHLYEFRLTHPQVPFKFALLQTVFQLCYTTLFGWYAAFVYLRTGSLWACVLTHSFCNWMGLPRLWGRVERPSAPQSAGFKTMTPKAPVAMGPPKNGPGLKGTDEPGTSSARGRSTSYVRSRAAGSAPDSILWTVAYYTILVGGAFGFYKGLWPLTRSTLQLAEI